MKRPLAKVLFMAFVFFFACNAFAEKVWIRDILDSPDRYWNREVTVIGEVLEVKANPEGTSRGDYFVRDDSTADRLCVRSRDLPPVGKTFEITGMIFQEQTSGNTLMREIRRNSPGFPSWMKILLIGGGLLFLILLIIFIILLVKPKGASRTAPTVRPTYRPPSSTAQPADLSAPQPTRKVSPPAAPAAAAETPDKTRAFLSLRANLIVDRGPDKGNEVTLHKQVTTIGRAGARKNDLELKDDTVSKQQASIYYDAGDGQFTIANESTTNPTQLNKKVLTEPTVLKDQDHIEAGATLIIFRKE